MQYSNTNYLFPAPVTINSVVASAGVYPYTAADVKGTSTTNGINYNVYSFASVSTTTNYTVNYTCNSATTIYVLAVGGGGSGSSSAGGGGGAGGVVMNPISLPAGSSSITISVGAGGASVGNGAMGINGTNTTVTFTSSTYNNITAYGGGPGGAVANTTNTSGGSSGGWGWGTTSASTGFPSPPLNQYNNYGNQQGAAGGGSNTYAGGGGGSGSCGVGANGGNGIQCYLPGITTFSSSGTSYSTYYWGGGGGGFSGSSGNASGNGGLGGGGGGTNSASGTVGIGGIGGINNGGIGGTGNGLNTGTGGGSGGTNTGSGGGGTYTNYSGAGGSGIVIIAFPSATPVTSNQSAVLPASIVSSGLYSATLNNITLSSLAYSSIKGAFACRLLNYNYFGPVMTLRHTLDTTGQYTQNFYSDICGNLGTGYLGTGQSVSTWLTANSANTTYAYVTKWYNQGMDVSFNSFTQYYFPQSPVYDVLYGVINFGYTTTGNYPTGWSQNSGFITVNNAFPYSDMSYSYTFRHWNLVPGSNGCVLQTGYDAGSTGVQFTGVAMLCNSTGYTVDWETNGITTHNYLYSAVPYAVNNVYSTTYTSGTKIRNLYINGTGNSDGSALASIRNQLPNNNVVGTCNSIGWCYGQLYNLYAFQSSLSTADRQIVEATPYQYSVLPTFFINLIAGSVTTSSLAVSTSYSGASFYTIYVNSSYVSTVTSLSSSTTITAPLTNKLNNINIYAYNATNNLIATNAGLLGTSINSVTATISSTVLLATRMDSMGANEACTKIVYSAWNGTNFPTYYTYYNGTAWTASVVLAGPTTAYCMLSSDGTIGVLSNYVITWTGTTPSTPVTYVATFYAGGSMSADGSRMVMSPASGTNNVYTWNGTTYVSSASFTLTNITGGSTMSPDGKYLFTINGGTIYYATWNGTTYANETTNVCSALVTFITATNYVRGIKIGAGNTIYISFWDTSGPIYLVAIAYNTSTGYWDRMSILYTTPAGFSSDISVPRYNQTGKMLYSYGGNTYSSGLLVT